MLLKPEYLDISDLDGYVASVEGGIRGAETRRLSEESGHRGGVDARIAGHETESTSKTESTVNITDHDVTKLKRLIDAGRKDPQETGWVEVFHSLTLISLA